MSLFLPQGINDTLCRNKLETIPSLYKPSYLFKTSNCKGCAVYGDKLLFLIGLNLIRKADRIYW
jgi:hypothetical protein